MAAKIEERAKELVESLLSDVAIKGIIISDNEGKPIFSLFSEEIDSNLFFDSARLAPVASTMLSVSAGSMRKLFNQNLESIVCFVGDNVFLLVPSEKANILASIAREILSLRGAEYYQEKLRAAVREISALMVTIGMEETISVKMKRAIPEALAVGIVTNEGLPLAFQSIIDDAALAAAANGLYVLATAMAGQPHVDYVAAQADQASLLLHKLDEERALVVVVPKEQKLGEYIAKIKQVLKS